MSFHKRLTKDLNNLVEHNEDLEGRARMICNAKIKTLGDDPVCCYINPYGRLYLMNGKLFRIKLKNAIYKHNIFIDDAPYTDQFINKRWNRKKLIVYIRSNMRYVIFEITKPTQKISKCISEITPQTPKLRRSERSHTSIANQSERSHTSIANQNERSHTSKL